MRRILRRLLGLRVQDAGLRDYRELLVETLSDHVLGQELFQRLRHLRLQHRGRRNLRGAAWHWGRLAGMRGEGGRVRPEGGGGAVVGGMGKLLVLNKGCVRGRRRFQCG